MIAPPPAIASPSSLSSGLRRFAAGLYVALVLVLAAATLGGVRYALRGDARQYFDDAAKLQGEYFARNWAALRGEGEGHQRLITEGAYPALLTLLDLLHPRAPYLANALLSAGTLALLGLLAWRCASRWRIGAAAAFAVPLLLLAHPVTAHLTLVDEVWPMRSGLGTFLAIAALLCSAGQNPSPARIAAAGVLLGLGTWARTAHLLFIVPLALPLVLDSARSLPSRIRRLALLGTGLLCGLLPLFGQNVFEGRAFYASGELEFLVTGDSSQVPFPKRVEGLQYGLKSGNFPLMLPIAFKELFGGEQTGWTLALGLLCAIAVFAQPRLAGSLLAGALGFLLVYCCWHDIEFRYFHPFYLLAFATAALGLGILADALLRSRRSGFFAALLLLLAGSCGALLWPQSEPHARTRAEWRDVSALRLWIAEHIPTNSVVLLNREYLLAWTGLTAPHPLAASLWPWTPDPRQTQQQVPLSVKEYAADWLRRGWLHPDWIAGVVASDRPVIFIEPSEDPPHPDPSWWRHDMTFNYRLERAGSPLDLPGHRLRITAYRLVPKPAAFAGDPLEQAWRNVALSEQEPFALPQSRRVRASFWREYDRAPSLARIVEPSPSFWRGWRHWTLDAGAYRMDRNATPVPYFRLLPEQRIHLPPLTEATQMRLFLSGTIQTCSEEPGRWMPPCALSSNGSDLPLLQWRWKDGRGYSAVLQTALEAMPEPGSQTLVLATDDTHPNFPVLLGADWMRAEPSAEGRTDTSSVQRVQALPSGGYPTHHPLLSTLFADETFRLLPPDQTAVIPLPTLAPGDLLAMEWAPSFRPEGGGGTLVFGSGETDAARFATQGPGPWVFLLKVEAASAPGRLAVRWIPETADEPSALFRVRAYSPNTVDLSPAGEGVFAPRGAHGAERQADGIWGRWTTAHSEIPLILERADANWILELEWQGPPESVAERTLRVQLNGVPMAELEAPAWEEGPQRIRLPLPGDAVNSGLNIIAMDSSAWSPAETLGSSDRRALGVLLRGIRLHAGPGE